MICYIILYTFLFKKIRNISAGVSSSKLCRDQTLFIFVNNPAVETDSENSSNVKNSEQKVVKELNIFRLNTANSALKYVSCRGSLAFLSAQHSIQRETVLAPGGHFKGKLSLPLRPTQLTAF
jgi:hypothetical protein